MTGLALSLAAQSAGAFDPTVGPLVARWGFGPIAGAERSDWRGLSVGQGGIAKRRDALTLDLCGIAKGWALDRAVDLAQAAGFNDLLFDLGGELRALGHHPSGRAWQVAVEGPGPTARDPVMLRLAPGQAVATSGLNAQSYALGGQRYGHIIDPGAGRPADTALHSVTVLASDSAHADGWATALFAAGDSAGPALAERHGIAALFLVGDGAGVRQIATGAMAGALL